MKATGGSHSGVVGTLLLLSLQMLDSASPARQLYIVKGTRDDGIYKQTRKGQEVCYTKMGVMSARRGHPILYKSTESPNTWVLGLGKSSGERSKIYQASGPDAPSSGWTSINPEDGPGDKISVTSVKLKTASPKQMFEGGGADTEDGIVCKTTKEDSDDGQWIQISDTGLDRRYCDKKLDCSNWIDEPQYCNKHRVVVTGSGPQGCDGVYETASHVGPNVYEKIGGQFFIFKADRRWKISKGHQENVIFESTISDTLPTEGWTMPGTKKERQGRMMPGQVPLAEIRVTVEFTGGQPDTSEGSSLNN